VASNNLVNLAKLVFFERETSITRYISMLVQLEGISLKRGVPILSDVNWTMAPKQNWVVLGSNGSGKTSLMRVILGNELASSGHFKVMGHAYGEVDWGMVRRQIGVVSHAISQLIDVNQMPEQIVLSGKRSEVNWTGETTPKEREEARRWLYFVGIEHLSERKWAVLSHGERQRVMIARALISTPKLLILDEPCSGLDPIAREDFLNFLQYTLTEEFKIPSIMITHHLEEVMPMFTHVMLMKAGKVAAQGPKEAMLRSNLISDLFSADVVVQPIAGRYFMNILRPSHK
jgi:iron complex transport system ATP-binding protein